MKKDYLLLITLILILFSSCDSPEHVFENKKKTCVLKLYKDNTYHLQYPIFSGGTKYETGTYADKGGGYLILSREAGNDIPEPYESLHREATSRGDTMTVSKINVVAIRDDEYLFRK